MTHRPSPWPKGHRFALFLSHDIDEIYPREFFRLLGDLNHLRRMWTQGEPGRTVPCLKRMARALLRPQPPGLDIEAILTIERDFAFTSTFFLLEDPVFSRHGGRYLYAHTPVKAIAERILAAGCELAVHGAYHAFNDAQAYRAQAEAFAQAFGVRPAGIRNHYLRHDGHNTWRAQAEAGYRYDASFGFNDAVGVREGSYLPFFPLTALEGDPANFVALPLTIMDSALFRRMRCDGPQALRLAKGIIADIAARGGLLCLSWHNNYFADEEYAHWQWTYTRILEILAEMCPYCATGERLAAWWAQVATQEQQP